MDDFHKEILEELKKLSVDQAIVKSNLESYLKQNERQETIITSFQAELKNVQKHDLILKGMVWIYGVVISAMVYHSHLLT